MMSSRVRSDFRFLVQPPVESHRHGFYELIWAAYHTRLGKSELRPDAIQLKRRYAEDLWQLPAKGCLAT